MKRRFAIVSASILTVVGMGWTSSMNAAFGADASADSAQQPAASPANPVGADSQRDVKGVQDLFAQATDAAVSKDGDQKLQSLFARENGNGPAVAPGAATPAQGTQSTPSSASSNTSNAPTSASPTERTAPQSGTNGPVRVPTDTQNSSPQGVSPATAQPSPAAGANNHDQIVQQFDQAWQAKYKQPFKIENGAVVLADIKADDILGGSAQPAASQLQGQRTPTNQDKAPAESTTPGASQQGGVSGAGSIKPMPSTPGNPPTPSADTPRREQTTTGAGVNTATPGQSTGPLAGTNGQNIGGAAGASATPNQDLSVTVPQVSGAPGVVVRVMRDGSQYKFVQSGASDPQRLNEAIDQQLQAVLSDQKDWPADANQAQRVVIQHVLLGISQYSSNENPGEARPAGAVLPGQGPANTSTVPPTGQIQGTNSR